MRVDWGMSTEVEPNDWACLDQWWAAYTQTQSIARSPALVRVISQEQLTDCWDELDPWWDRYSETGYGTAVRISDLLEQSNEKWENSSAPFDTDPLAADLSGERFLRGPLRPNSEVEWSQWLAQLMRPSVALTSELFGISVDHSPDKVIRETQLTKQDGSFRRPDILLCHADQGISIEVKLNDENYTKTAETARLVERHYNDLEWTHVLLLPKRKKERLNSLLKPSLNLQGNDRLQVEWENPGPVDVRYWCDVTTAIRSLLQRGMVVDDHWAANAYLFCTVAEQQIMNFQPQPIIERLAAPTNIVDMLQPIQIADTLEEQLTYLRERMNL